MAELDELIKIRQLLEAIAGVNGAIIERLPTDLKTSIETKNSELINEK